MTVLVRSISLVLLFLLTLSFSVAQTGPSFPQATPKDTRLEDVEAIITEFIDNISARKFEEAVRVMSLLGHPYEGDHFKKTIMGLDIIGVPFYYEKIIDRFYGKTGKDLIFKISSDTNVYFFRFILHKRAADNWAVTWLGIQTEMQAPLPRVWSHMLP